MTLFLIIFLTISLMILANALYVAAEFATISARRTRIGQMAQDGNRLAKLLLPIMRDSHALDNYIAACQIGITISSLVLGSYGQNNIAELLAPLLLRFGALSELAALSISATLVLIFLTILQVMLGELFPKSVAIQYPERLALLTVIPMRWSLPLFKPLIWFFNGSGRLILNLMKIEGTPEHTHVHSPQEIELLTSESYEGGLLDHQEQQMVRNALRLRDLVGRQVMVPRTKIVAAPVNQDVEYLINLAAEAGISRIPLYEGTIDNIIGFVHIKDLFRLRLEDQSDPAAVIRNIEHIPESVPILDLWNTLKRNRQYIAIVFDEYGGTAGMLTFEDLIEEIFGELQDEFDDEIPLISGDPEGRVHLRGDLLVSDVNEYLNLNLPEDEADTLGGLVFVRLGQPPNVGDAIRVGDPEKILRVEAVDQRQVVEVSLPANAARPYITEWETSTFE